MIAAVDAAEAKLRAGRSLDTAIVEYVRAVDAACAQDVSAATIFRDPACAASRVVLLWAHDARCDSGTDRTRREAVARAVDEATAFASQDALMTHHLFCDALRVLRALRVGEKQFVCFEGTQRAIHAEASVLERTMQDDDAERELYKRLRNRVSAKVDANDEMRALWARRGMTSIIARLLRSNATRQFVEIDFWREGWQELWHQFDTVTSTLDIEPGISQALASASCAIGTATANATAVAFANIAAPRVARRSLERAVGMCLKGALAAHSNKRRKGFAHAELESLVRALAVAAAFAFDVCDSSRLEFYVAIAVDAAHISGSGTVNTVKDDDNNYYGRNQGHGSIERSSSPSAEKSLLAKIRKEFQLAHDDANWSADWVPGEHSDAVLAVRVVLSAIHDSLACVSASSILLRRIVPNLFELLEAPSATTARRELVACFEALQVFEDIMPGLLNAATKTPVCTYVALTVAGRRLPSCREPLATDVASLDQLARDYCLNVTAAGSLDLLVDIALAAACACSASVGDACLTVARDATLHAVVAQEHGDDDGSKLVAIIRRIAASSDSGSAAAGTINILREAWRTHPECPCLANVIRLTLPSLARCAPTQIGARLAIVQSLQQPGCLSFAASALRFVFSRSALATKPCLVDINAGDNWWEVHAELVAELVNPDRHGECLSDIASAAIAVLEACASYSTTSSSRLSHPHCGEVFGARLALTKLLDLATNETPVESRTRGALSIACSHIVGERGAACRAAFCAPALDGRSSSSNKGDETSCRALIEALETRCASAMRRADSAAVAAVFAAMGAIIELDRNPKTKFGSWALEALARVWRTTAFSGLAYSELRRVAARRRIAESCADAEHRRLLSDASGVEDVGLEAALNAACIATPEADGTLHVTNGDRSPLTELKSLVEALAMSSGTTGRTTGFGLIEALGTLVFRPRRRRERLAVEATPSGTASMSRQRDNHTPCQKQRPSTQPSIGYGLTIAAAAAPCLIAADARRDGQALGAISPYSGSEAEKALVQLRPATCLCEVTLSVVRLRDPKEFERLASFTASLLGGSFGGLLKHHVDKLTALLAAELAGPRIQEARSALRLVADHCVEELGSVSSSHATGDETVVGGRNSNTAVKQLFAEKFLMIAARVVHHDWDKEESPRNKAARLRVMAHAVDYLEPQVAVRFAPKIMATLSAALFDPRVAEGPENQYVDLIGGAVDALSRYTRLLPTAALKSQVGAIVTALTPAVKHVSNRGTLNATMATSGPSASSIDDKKFVATRRAVTQRAADLLRWLLVERKEDLGLEAFEAIPCFPALENDDSLDITARNSIREAHDSFIAALRTASGSSPWSSSSQQVPRGEQDDNLSLSLFSSEISRLAHLVEHESTHVQLAAIDAIRCEMSRHHDHVATLVLDPSRSVATPVAAALSALLRIARKSAKLTNDALKLACAACVGELGAIDQTRLLTTKILVDANARRRERAPTVLTTVRSTLAGGSNVANGFSLAASDKELGHVENRTHDTDDVPPPPWQEERDHLAARLICSYLVRALREGAGSQGQDCAAYAIQELLKLLRGRADTMPPWAARCFQSAGCYELVAPYAVTEYEISGDVPKYKRRRNSLQAEAVKYANQSSRWLSTWTRLLALRAKSTTHAPIFRACRAVFRFDDGLAAALLPYLVADALCCGDDVDAQGVVAELKAIIALASSCDAAAEQDKPSSSKAPPPCRMGGQRDVFSLHATLDRWCDDAAMNERHASNEDDNDDDLSLSSRSASTSYRPLKKKSKKSLASSTSSQASSRERPRTDAFPDDESVHPAHRIRIFPYPFLCFNAIIDDDEHCDARDDTNKNHAEVSGHTQKRPRSPTPGLVSSDGRIVSARLGTAVEALSYAALSRAAESMGAYARALMYYERGVKQRSLKARLNALPGAAFSDHADGYLPALHADDIEALQRLAWRLDDDPDYLAGLAAARGVAGSRATLVQLVREHESEGQWRDALHCYEHILRVHAMATPSTNDFVENNNGADAIVARTMSIEDAARGLVQCQLELGHLESAVVNADGFLSDTSSVDSEQVRSLSAGNRQSMLASLAPVAAEAAWRLRRWPRLKALLRQCETFETKQRGGSAAVERDPRVGLARCIAALHDYALTVLTSDGTHRIGPNSSDKFLFEQEIATARLEAMAGLSAASMESYVRAYPFVARLSALQELEHAKTLIEVTPLEVRQRYYRDNLAPHWEARLRGAASATAIDLLALRRACLELAGLRRDAADCCELSARLARKAGRVSLAQSDVRDAARLGASSDALLIAEAKLARVDGSPTSALRAYAMLEPVELDVRSTRATYGLLEYHEGVSAADTSRAIVASRGGGPLQRRQRVAVRRALAKRLVLATDCLVDAQMRHGADVVQRYMLAIDLRPKWDRAYFGCGRVYDSMLASRRRELVAAAKGTATSDTTSYGMGATFAESVCDFDPVAHDHAKAAIRHYALCLEHSAKYAETALPRLLTLWFEFAAIDNTAISEFGRAPPPVGASRDGVEEHTKKISSVVASLKRLQSAINQTIKHVRKNVQGAVIYGAVQQLVSRAGHPNQEIREGVLQLLSKVMEMHPRQALYAVSGLLHSTNTARQTVGTKVLSTAIVSLKKRGGARQDVISLEAAKTFFKDLISLARLKVPGTLDQHGRKFTVKVELTKKIFRMTPIGQAAFVVPTRAALTPELPHTDYRRRDRGNDGISASAATSALAGDDEDEGDSVVDEKRVPWPTFPTSAPRIAKVDDTITVLGTKALPKRITFATSDGRKVDALCKCETDGDFRKDARVQDFNDVVNRLFARDRDSQRRKLRLRTYTVVILDEQCGLCEWVTNTASLRTVIKGSYQMRKFLRSAVAQRAPNEVPDFNSPSIKRAWDSVEVEATLKGKIAVYRRLVLTQFSPCLSIWFERVFSNEPAAWLEARAMYARSVATWSAVGYLIGLGDRHSENILIDTKSGECVHVDFDCLFDKGASLRVPERVPFRLTTHVVEPLGITGVNGCFRRSLESALATLRDHKETLLNVLEPFLRDPTVGWTRLGKAQDEANGNDDDSRRKQAPHKRPRLRGGTDRDEEGRAAWHLGIISQRLSGIVIFPVPKNPALKRDRDKRGDRRRDDSRGGDETENSPTDLLPLSVAGQAERLIKEATSDANLCRMWIGWQPFL